MVQDCGCGPKHASGHEISVHELDFGHGNHQVITHDFTALEAAGR